MRNLVPQRSGNPVLRGNTFEGLSTTGERMTIDGTVNRSFALVAILLVGAGISIITSPGLAILGAVVGFVLALVTVFKKEWSPVTAPLYALAEGVFLGGFSVILEAEYPGIVIPAVSLTVAIFIAFLLIYRTHLIRVTDKLRIGIVAATGGVVLLYLADLVLNLVGVHVSYLNEAVAGSGLRGERSRHRHRRVQPPARLRFHRARRRRGGAQVHGVVRGLRPTGHARVAVRRSPATLGKGAPPLKIGSAC